MSWSALIEIIADIAGDALAAKVESRARKELGGARITVLKRKIITKERIDAAAAGKPKEAAKKLGVHYSTVYRTLNRRPIR